MMLRAPSSSTSSCIFCQIACSSTSTILLHSDEKVVAFQDINPSAFRHYLVIPIEHIPTVENLQRRAEDYALVSHMLDVGQTLLRKDAPNSKYRNYPLHFKNKKQQKYRSHATRWFNNSGFINLLLTVLIISTFIV